MQTSPQVWVGQILGSSYSQLYRFRIGSNGQRADGVNVFGQNSDLPFSARIVLQFHPHFARGSILFHRHQIAVNGADMPAKIVCRFAASHPRAFSTGVPEPCFHCSPNFTRSSLRTTLLRVPAWMGSLRVLSK